MRTEFEEYISTGMLGSYHPESAMVRWMEDGSVDTVFADTTQTDSTWNREMLIEGRVFHVTSVFAGEPSATPTEKLLALIDTELAKESQDAINPRFFSMTPKLFNQFIGKPVTGGWRYGIGCKQIGVTPADHIQFQSKSVKMAPKIFNSPLGTVPLAATVNRFLHLERFDLLIRFVH